MQFLIDLIQKNSPGGRPLFLAIRGSHAYGTNIEGSDIDYTGVFCQSEDSFFGMGECPQISDDSSDIVIYEIGRFLELLIKNNPTMLEILNLPEDCILYKDPIFDTIIEKKDEFVTKGCMFSFGGYAREQILKAKGQDKKQNWEKSRVTRKSPIDFCYLVKESNSISLVEYLSTNQIDQKECGLCKVPNSRDLYALYIGDSFRGVSFEDSNDVRLSSIPKGSKFIGNVSYNKDGYIKHCADYKSYQTWITERNDQRWVDVSSHGQKIDGKNMMHCVRLITMAKEISSGKGVIVRRPDFEYLISIRRGSVDLQSLIDKTNSDIEECDRLFKESTLPDKVDITMVNNLLLDIRKFVYK